MKPKDPALLVLAFIIFVNSLAYGTIIPLLYPYAVRFGITPPSLALLFASYSVTQFIATPILGRLSDRFGRKPILLLCLLGTSLSLAMFAVATNILLLFIARLFDGITGGNISVAQAMIADKTSGEHRSKSFGFLLAAFGAGFVAGPAVGGLLSQFGLTAPFWFAAILALLGTILGQIILKETLPKEDRQPSHEPLFRVKTLYEAFFKPLTGEILAISFLLAIAQNAIIIGVQSYTVDNLQMSAAQTGVMFTAVGIINILTQVVGLRYLLHKFKNTVQVISVLLFLSTISLLALFFVHTINSFLIVLFAFAVFSSPIGAIITGLLSERTKDEDQGGILGLNQSYNSLGQIIGPLLAGAIAARIATNNIFLASAGVFVATLLVSVMSQKKATHKLDL